MTIRRSLVRYKTGEMCNLGTWKQLQRHTRQSYAAITIPSEERRQMATHRSSVAICWKCAGKKEPTCVAKESAQPFWEMVQGKTKKIKKRKKECAAPPLLSQSGSLASYHVTTYQTLWLNLLIVTFT